VVNLQQTDNPENESFYSVGSSDANDLPNQIISEQIPLTFQESLDDNSKMNMSNEYEKMDISEENPCSEHEQIEVDDMSENVMKDEEMVLSSADEDCVILTSDEEDIKEIPVSILSPKNTSLPLKRDIKLLTPKSVPIDKKKTLDPSFVTLTPLKNVNNCPNIQENISKNENPLLNYVSTACTIQNNNSNDQRPVKKTNDEIDLIFLDSDEDESESDILSVGSSSKKSSENSIILDGSVITGGSIGSGGRHVSDPSIESDGSIVSENSFGSENSDLEITRYGRFRQDAEDSNDEENGEYIEEEEEGEELDNSEQYDGDSEESESDVSSEQSENMGRNK